MARGYNNQNVSVTAKVFMFVQMEKQNNSSYNFNIKYQNSYSNYF